MKLKFSIRTLLAIASVLSIVVGVVVYRVNAQRRAASTIINYGGETYHEEIKLDQSFATHLLYSITEIKIPEAEQGTAFNEAIECLPNLECIGLSGEYDPDALARMRTRFPHVRIKHDFVPLIDLINPLRSEDFWPTGTP